MTRMLTIISGAGIMVLVLMPVLVLHKYWTAVDPGPGPVGMDHHIAARAILVSLMVIGVTVSGATALILIRLFDRHIRG